MTNIILPRRALAEQPFATDDESYQKLVNDPSVPQFTQQGIINNYVPPQQQINLTQASDNAAQNAEILVKNSNQDWINKKWRPAMSWMYMAVCITDFIIFPILWSILQAIFKGQVPQQWQPLTLQGGGLFHMAMGAVLGIAAYGRTKEKLEGKQ